MTPLRQRMMEDMQIRNLSPVTQDCYLRAMAQFAAYFGVSPDQLGPEHIRKLSVAVKLGTTFAGPGRPFREESFAVSGTLCGCSRTPLRALDGGSKFCLRAMHLIRLLAPISSPLTSPLLVLSSWNAAARESTRVARGQRDLLNLNSGWSLTGPIRRTSVSFNHC